VTIGLSSVFKGVAQLVWSGDYRAFPPIFPRMPILLGNIVIPSRQFYSFLIAIAASALIWLAFRFTRTGVSMRATANDQAAASRAVVRRGLEIFGLAFLFRVQAWVLGWSSPRTLLV